MLWSVRLEVDLRRWADLRNVMFRIGHQFLSFLVDFESRRFLVGHDNWSAIARACTVLRGIMVPHSIDIQTMSQCSSTAISLSSKALYRALHGTVQVFRYGERLGGVLPDKEEVLDHFRVALQTEPTNGLVNAFAGHAFSFFKQPGQGASADGIGGQACAVKRDLLGVLCPLVGVQRPRRSRKRSRRTRPRPQRQHDRQAVYREHLLLHGHAEG